MEDSGFQLFESNEVDTNLSEDLDEHMEDELTESIGDMFDMEDSGLQDHCKNSVSEDLNDHMEDTKNSRDEEFDDRTLFKGKPYKDLTLEDLRGVEFKSVEDVDRFYSYYSLAMGFSMRKFKLDKNRSGTQFNRRVLVCSKQGKRKESGREDSFSEDQGLRGVHENPLQKSAVKDCQPKHKGKKQCIGQSGNQKQCTKTRRITRGNCPASFTVKWCSQRGVFYASKFITEHNHTLARVEHRQFLRSHRHVSEHDLAQVSALKKVSVQTCRAYELLVHQAGGHEYVGFTVRDLYNKLKGEKEDLLLDGDAQASITWMNMRAIRDPHFYCIYSGDENGRLANMFWRDGQSLSDFTNFGDVLIFDSTYKTNIYGKPLAVFVGSNNHRATVLFGCALLVDETEETYKWVLNSFLTSMHGKKPMSIITDGDDAMRNAVSDLIPEARHRLCAWHIGKNVCQHLKDEDTRKEFFHLIFAGLTVDKWESAWQYFVAMNRLENDKWVTSMYNKRERWAEAFFRDQFFAGICSTQRCEGMHRNLKGGIGRYMRLCEVLPRMEKTIHRIRNRVLEDDFRSEHCEPVYGTHLRCLEEHIGQIFTHDIFLLIKDQIKFESKFVIGRREVHLHNSSESISLTQYGKPERRWTVFYQPDESNPIFVCSCKLFESDGIPCCHIFAVMKCEMITMFPESLVNERWKKDAGVKRKSTLSGSANDQSTRIARYGELMGICAKICHLASYSEEGYDETREALRQMTLKSKKYKPATEAPIDVPFEGLHPNVIRDPVVCRTKGGKSKAGPPGDEENYKSKVGKGCKICHMSGHNRRTCLLRNSSANEGKQATQQTKVKGCSKQVGGNKSDNSASEYETSDNSDCGKESNNMPKSGATSLIHNLEEARPLEFFTGYEKSNNLERDSTSSGLPEFFEHFRPFSNA